MDFIMLLPTRTTSAFALHFLFATQVSRNIYFLVKAFMHSRDEIFGYLQEAHQNQEGQEVQACLEVPKCRKTHILRTIVNILSFARMMKDHPCRGLICPKPANYLKSF